MIELNSSAPRSNSRGSKVVRGFPALASAMNETKRRRKFLMEANVVFFVAKEKINIFGKTAFDISSLVNVHRTLICSCRVRKAGRK